MYTPQEIPDETAILGNGVVVKPLITLKDSYGGVAHIINDDHCYVLIIGHDRVPCRMISHWFSEAVSALRTLPPPT